mgnify:CR=1 FL=1
MLLAANKFYYSLHPNQLTIRPASLSLLNERTHNISFVKRDSDQGRTILRKMYGRYDSCILTGAWPVSTPSAAEFTLPQLRYNGDDHILREHPGLRYRLWQCDAPDVILLGSSMFFCGFSREVFFDKYPGKYLLDFTTGNNTPFIASWLMRYADSSGLKFKPGTIVLYGMNRVEMLASYKDSNSHDYVKQAVAGKIEKRTLDKEIEQFLHIPELRYDLATTLKDKYNAWFRNANVYRAAVPKKYLVNEEALIEYIKNEALVNNSTQEFDPGRVKEVQALADFLQQRDCKLVILKLPQSLYNDKVLNTTGYSWFDQEMQKLEHENIRYIDVSGLPGLGLTQLDYIWPGSIFDPEHLNLQGAKKFTNVLMRQVLDTMLQKKDIIY